VVSLRSGKTPYLRFDLNDYSIPHTLVQKPLTLVASPTTVRILDGACEVARHARSWSRHERVENEAHIAALVKEKRAARESRGKSRLTQAVPGAAAFLEAVVVRGQNLGNTTAQLNRFLDEYGAPDLTAAIHEAMERQTPTASSVALLLEQQRRRRRQKPPVRVELPADPRVRDLRVTPHNLETYDALTRTDDV
jgi:hypothetical protein